MTHLHRGSTMLRVWIALILLMLQASGGNENSPPAALSDQTIVSIVTMGPGDEAWEKFGHNMLRINDPVHGIDVVFNWGTFDFDQKHFIFHYLQGGLMYWMEPLDAQGTLKAYADDDRTIWEQEINLSQKQTQALWDFCMNNMQDANKFYQYNYFTDNCSTRVRDAIDAVIGGQIKSQASAMPSDPPGLSYRFETDRLTADDPVLYTALYYILGQPTDQKISAAEEMFIPLRLRVLLNRMMIQNDAGEKVPLVKKEITHRVSRRPPLRDAPPNRVGWFLLAGILIAAIFVACGFAMDRNRFAKWSFILVAMVWSLFAGFAGWLLAYFWVLTLHVATQNNENILQMSPLLLPLVVLLPFAAFGWRRCGKVASFLAIAAAGISLLGLILKIFPAMYQTNANVIALALPANAALAIVMWKRSLARTEQA